MDNISTSFEKSLNSDTMLDLASDYGELALDDLVDNPILKEIPVIKTLLAFGKFGRNVRDAFNVRKLARFLFRIKSVTEEEKNKFFAEIDKDLKAKRKVFEQIVLLIDRHEEERKTDMLANLFKVYLRREISQIVFFKLASVIDQVSIWDLLLSQRKFDGDESDELALIKDELSSVRVNKILAYHSLLEETIEASDYVQRLTGHNGLDYGFKYKTTDLGKLFFMYAYDERSDWL